MKSVRPIVNTVESLQKVLKLSATNGDNWCIFAHVINSNIVDKDGKVDDFRGAIIPLGSYGDRIAAEKQAKKIIEDTGYPGITVARYATFIPLSVTPNPETITTVPVDIHGKVMKIEKERSARENQLYEQQQKYQESLEKESQDETDPTNIEHFKRNCYLAIKNWVKYQNSKKESEQALVEYTHRRDKVRDHYKRLPDHETEWLPYFKAKLEGRNEISLYGPIEATYLQIRKDLLDLDTK